MTLATNLFLACFCLFLVIVGFVIGDLLNKRVIAKRMRIREETAMLRYYYLIVRTGTISERMRACQQVLRYVTSDPKDIPVEFLRRFLEEIRRVREEGGDFRLFKM